MPAHAAPHRLHVPREPVELLLHEPERREHHAGTPAQVPVAEARAVLRRCSEVADEPLPQPGVVPHDAAVEQRGRRDQRALGTRPVDGGPRLHEVHVARPIGDGVVQRGADADAGTWERGHLDGENVVPAQRGQKGTEPRGVAGLVAGEIVEVIVADRHDEPHRVAVRERDLRRRRALGQLARCQPPCQWVEVVQRGREGLLQPR
jgi:hypothetical protein